jgi:Tol biopolymer transport system component
VLNGVRGDVEQTHFSVGRNGTLAYVSSAAGLGQRLVWIDRRGQKRPFVEPRDGPLSRRVSHPRISPDGTKVVVSADGELWIHDIERGTRTRLRARGSRPIWMSDSRSIMFAVQRRLYSVPIDDSREPLLIQSAGEGELIFPLGWSRDGRVFAYSTWIAATGRDIWMRPALGEPTSFVNTTRDERAAMFSPDGQWVVYAAKDTGRDEDIYVQPYPGPGDRLVVSRGGGMEPVWSPTGREIFFRSPDGRRMMAVEVQTRPLLKLGVPRLLFETPYPVASTYWADYDVTRDGEAFLMVESADTAPLGVHVVINWMTEVVRRLSAE